MSEKAKNPLTLKQKIIRAGGVIGLVGAIGGGIAIGEHNQSEELTQNSAPAAASSSKVPHPDLETSTSAAPPTTTTAETRQAPQPESVSPAKIGYNIATMGQNVRIMFDQAPADQKSTTAGPNGVTTYTATLAGRDGTKYTLKDTQNATYSGTSAGVKGVSVEAEGNDAYTFTISQTEDGNWDFTCKDATHDVHITEQDVTLNSNKVITDPGQAEVALYKATYAGLDAIGNAYNGGGSNPVPAFYAQLGGN